MEKDEGLSEFMKFSYSKGKVKESKEAFEKYPPSQEWHKGKIESILREK